MKAGQAYIISHGFQSESLTYRVVECVGEHKGEPLTMTWEGLFVTEEHAANAARSVGLKVLENRKT